MRKSNITVEFDAAARIHSSFAGLGMMRNTLPPLASNDLFERVAMQAIALRTVDVREQLVAKQ